MYHKPMKQVTLQKTIEKKVKVVSENISSVAVSIKTSLNGSVNPLEKYRIQVRDFSKDGYSPSEILARVCQEKSVGVEGVEVWGYSYRVHAEILANEKEWDLLLAEYKTFAEAWWLAQARKHISGGRQDDKLDYATWISVMKNNFGWADKTEIKHVIEAEERETIDRYINDGIVTPTEN